MAEAPPSLISLCIDALAQQFLRPSDDLPSIYDLPSHLLHTLITRLPPFALRTFHRHHLPFDEEGFSRDDSTKKRKRARDWNLSSAWQRLFLLRWPDRVKQIQPTDWEQHYWEIHLQDCLDEAAEVALIPSFSGYIGDIQISDSILKYIGFVGNTSHSSCDHSKLSYHCLQFGSHVSCLMLQNVLCTAETSFVEGMQATESGTKMYPIQGTIIERVQKHGIQHLSIIATSFLEPCAVSLPSGLMSFLSSGRSLCSLKLSDNQHGRTFAKDLFVTLLNLSSGISVLDLSENRLTKVLCTCFKIAGWLSDFNRRFLSGSHMSFGNGKSLKLLRVLNLRENNLGKDDVESLRYALQHVPNLEELDISGNSIEDEGIRNLIPYFVGASETCPHITCLKLENCDLSCVGVNNLLHILSNFKGPLKSLSIADNYLGSQVAEALGKFFSTPIEVLDIAGIGLGSYGFQELQSLIKEKVKLVKINISKNRGGIATAKFLSKLLSQAPQLVDVNAASNLMPIESLAIICSALKFAKGNVQQVDLTGHIWDYKPEHVSPYTEFVHNGLPILILPSSSASAAPHDHDP
ncbi:Ribonuclease inhibitor [Glycine max]|nr:Ribonuclease inhibitor [Glycine max]